MIRLLMVPTCAAKFSLSLVIALSVLPAIGWAQIYKYQDANGKWQFTDKPPQAGQEVKIYHKKIKSHSSDKQAIDRFSARLKSGGSELGAARSRYNLRHSNTMLAQQFTIILKDDTPLNARLVALSDRYDLALLKVDGYTTPFIPIAKNNTYRQGYEVFAIGSPLGNTDYMTSGIITSLK